MRSFLWGLFLTDVTPHSYGVFRLTDPPGLNFILECTVSSSFHPHTQEHLYTVSC